MTRVVLGRIICGLATTWVTRPKIGGYFVSSACFALDISAKNWDSTLEFATWSDVDTRYQSNLDKEVIILSLFYEEDVCSVRTVPVPASTLAYPSDG